MAPEERPGPSPSQRALGAVLAAAALLLALWLLIGEPERVAEPEPEPEPEPGAEPVDSPDALAPPVVEPRPPPLEERPRPPPPAPEISLGPEVRPFERRIASRLAATRPSTAPIEEPVRIRMTDVVWDDPAGEPFFRASEVDGLFALNAAVAGAVAVDELTLVEPVLFLEEEPGPPTRWNYEAVFARLTDEERDGAAAVGPVASVVLRDVGIEDGRLTVRRPGPEAPYRATDIDADVPLAVLAAPEPDTDVPRVAVERLDAIVGAPDLTEPMPVTVTTARLRLPDEQLEFDVGRLTADGAEISAVSGTWNFDAAGLGLTLDASVANLPLARLQPFLPQLPPTGEASFTLAVEPLADARSSVRLSDLVATAEGSTVTGSIALAVAGGVPATLVRTDLLLDPLAIGLLEPITGPLPYSGTLRGTIEGPGDALTFDVAARLTAPDIEAPLIARLSGQASLTDGFGIESLVADLDDVPAAALEPFAPGVLPPEARVTGRVALDGAPEDVPLTLDVDVSLDGGLAAIEGTIDVSGPEPAYDVAGQLVDLPIRGLAPIELPPVLLTAEFSLVGSGSEPVTADAQLALDGTFAGWQSAPGDAVRIDVDFDEGVVALDTLSLELATLSLEAGGVWRFRAPPSGGIDYDLAIEALEPFSPYLPLPVDGPVWGEIATRGELTGTLDVPRFAGDATAEALRFGRWFVASAQAEYDVVAPPRRGLDVDLVAEGVETPQAGEFERAEVVAAIDDPTFDVAVQATRPQTDDGVLLVADGRFLDGARVATLRELLFDFDGSPWTLAESATVRWGDEEGVEVDDLRIREVDGAGILAFDGRFPPAGGEGLMFRAEAVPVAEWFRLAGRVPPLTGMVWADGELFGTLAEPRFDVDFQVLQPRIDDVELARFEGDVAYGAGRLSGTVDLRIDTLAAPTGGGTLDIDGSAPFVLSFEDGVEAGLAETGAVQVEAVADSLPAALLDPLLFDVRDLEGWLDGRVVATGAIQRPTLDGGLVFSQGAATILPLDQRYEEISATVEFEDRRAVVRDARARSDGLVLVTGTVGFETLDQPDLDLLLEFDGFRPVGVEDHDPAAVWGELRAVGPASAPVVSGEVQLDDGTVPIPGMGDDAFEAGFDDAAVAETDVPLDTVDVQQPGWLDRVVIDAVALNAGEDLWFGSEQIRAQLTGELTLIRTAPDALQIFGSLSGERGSITLVAGPIVRQLDIVEAEVRFFGGTELDPAIDITASQTVFGPDAQPYDILVQIGGTLDDPTLALASPDGAPVPESELLSLLVFGQPTYALAPGVVPAEEVVGDVFFGGLAGLAAIELEEALVGEVGLPFEYVRIQPGPGEFGGLFGAPIIVLGTEISEDLFLTIDTGLGTIFGGTEIGSTWGVALQWRIDPEWTVELGIEPVFRGRFFPTAGFIMPTLSPEQQFFIDLRRRWTY